MEEVAFAKAHTLHLLADANLVDGDLAVREPNLPHVGAGGVCLDTNAEVVLVDG